MKKLLLALSFFLFSMLAHTQETNQMLLQKLVDKNILTEDEAREIAAESKSENKTEQAVEHTVDKVRNAFNTPYMRFGGYAQFMYRYSDVNRVKHSAEPKVLFISMRGELNKKFSYFVLADFVRPTPHEFWGEWSAAKEFNLRIGQTKTPLSLESQISLTDIEGVMNTRSVSALIGMADDVQRLQNGKNNGGRDVGLLSHGSLFKTKSHDLIQYRIGLFQGTGINTSENNNSKDFAGNIMLQPIKDFRIGGGAYFGEALYEKVGQTGAENHVRNRWIVSSDYKSERLYARAEWIKGNDGGIKKEGLHGVALWYFIPKQLNAFGKIDYLSENKSTNREVVDYTVGVNYYFWGACRVQLNYTYSDYSRSWESANSNLVLAQLQFVL